MVGIEVGSYRSFPDEKRKYNVNLIINAGMKYFRFVYQVEGSVVFGNKRKGLELIKEAARRNYIHAEKWLERNVENKDSE